MLSDIQEVLVWQRSQLIAGKEFNAAARLDQAIAWLDGEGKLIGELLAMLDELVSLTHLPDHAWDGEDWMRRNDIEQRCAEIEAMVKSGEHQKGQVDERA